MQEVGWKPTNYNKWEIGNGEAYVINSQLPPILVIKEVVNAKFLTLLPKMAQHYQGQGMQNGVDWKATFALQRRLKTNLKNIMLTLSLMMLAQWILMSRFCLSCP